MKVYCLHYYSLFIISPDFLFPSSFMGFLLNLAILLSLSFLLPFHLHRNHHLLHLHLLILTMLLAYTHLFYLILTNLVFQTVLLHHHLLHHHLLHHHLLHQILHYVHHLHLLLHLCLVVLYQIDLNLMFFVLFILEMLLYLIFFKLILQDQHSMLEVYTFHHLQQQLPIFSFFTLFFLLQHYPLNLSHGHIQILLAKVEDLHQLFSTLQVFFILIFVPFIFNLVF